MKIVTPIFLTIILGFQCGYTANGQTVSDGGRLDEKLGELKSRVESSVAREIAFKEERLFSFRNKPIELEGVLRLWNEVGISIAYPESSTVLILDNQGLLMRKISKDGTFREKSGDVENAGMIHLLKAAFEFNRDDLEQLFTLKLIEDQNQWSIQMVPRDDKDKKIEAVIIHGRELDIDRIDLAFSEKKQIRIFPLAEDEKPGFTEEVQRLYFRSSGD